VKGILSDLYQVKAAINGKMALKIVEKVNPDLILLDVMMPDMDGYEVCKILKKTLTQGIPVIFVTAMNQEHDEEKGFKAGAIDYITKPVKPALLLARVKNHLTLRGYELFLEEKVEEKTKELQETRLEIINKLGVASEYKDNETGHHIMRMSQYAYFIGQAYGLDKVDLDLLLNASPMHDVGKIGIPDVILQKKGKLNDDEWKIMKTHSQIGGRILSNSQSKLLEIARIIALEHHEKWNGSGYPEALAGDKIHLFARIVAVADVFDALTSKRPYKEAWSIEKAVSLIESEAGGHFDPEIVNAFIKALPKIIDVKEAFSD